MSELLAEKIDKDVSSLSEYEKFFTEGEVGELRVYLDRALYQSELDQLQQRILNEGVVLIEPIVQDARVLVIKFQKAIAPLLIIAVAIGAVVSGITGWQIFKTVQQGVPIWTWVVGGLALAYLLFREPAKQAVKVYVGRKMLK